MTESILPRDAFKILGLSGNVTPELIKAAYRKACKEFHPDRNPAGLEMMKLVNSAFNAVKDFTGETETSKQSSQYGKEVMDALNLAVSLGLNIEICGAWIWVSGDTKPYKEQLKAGGFKWASKKQHWYFRPSDHKSRSRGNWTMNDIRAAYGSKSYDDSSKQNNRHKLANQT